MTRQGMRAVALGGWLLFAPLGAMAAEICGDLDGNGTVASSDALRLLRFAVGQSVSIVCPAAVAGGLCWDTNGNSQCDAEEDVDLDATCSVLDCRGPAGPPGSDGPPGPAGPQGPAGPGSVVATRNAAGPVDTLGIQACPGGEPSVFEIGLADPVSVSAGQKVVIQTVVGLGTSVGATQLKLSICSRDESETLQQLGSGMVDLKAAAGTRSTYSLPGIFTTETGTFRYGICGCAKSGFESDWNDNDFYTVTVMVVN